MAKRRKAFAPLDTRGGGAARDAVGPRASRSADARRRAVTRAERLAELRSQRAEDILTFVNDSDEYDGYIMNVEPLPEVDPTEELRMLSCLLYTSPSPRDG